MEHDFDLHLNKVGKKRRSGKMSKKWMKRCMAVLLSAVLATGTCLPALAADQPEAQEEAASSSASAEMEEAADTQPEEIMEGTESPEEQEEADNSDTETEETADTQQEENGEEAESPETAEDRIAEETDQNVEETDGQNAEEADSQNVESEEGQADTQEETADPETSDDTNEASDASEPEETERLDEAFGEGENDDASTADSEEQTVEEQPEEVTDTNDSNLGSEEGETDAWLADYEYEFSTVDENTDVVLLTSYNGADLEITVPGIAMVNGVEYPVTCHYNIWPNSIERFTVGEGFIFQGLGDFFANYTSLISVDLSAADTSRVTDVSGAFNGCSNLRNLDLSECDWSNVKESMGIMYGCDSLEELSTPVNVYIEVELPCLMSDTDGNTYSYIPYTNVPIVLNKVGNDERLADYEYGISTLNDGREVVYLYQYNGTDREINVPGIAVVNGISYPVSCDSSIWPDATKIVFEPGFIFYNCNSFFYQNTSLVEVDLSGADTSMVTGTNCMFSGCSNLQDVNLGSIDLSQVTDASNMFNGCTSLEELELSCFSGNTGMQYVGGMFYDCSSLRRLDLGGWDWSGIEDSENFLYGCKKLEELITPINALSETKLPCIMSDSDENTYMSLPYKHESITLNKTVIEAWLSDYEYELDCDNNRLNLISYNGTESEITLPASITYGQNTFTVRIDDTNWSDTVTSFSFEEPYSFYNVENSSCFSRIENLETLDLRNVYFSTGDYCSPGFYKCSKLKTIYLPAHYCSEDRLPKVFKDEEGNLYTSTPIGLSTSIKLQAVDCSEWLLNFSYSIDEEYNEIVLQGYKGTEENIIVQANAEVGGIVYNRIRIENRALSSTKAKYIKVERGVILDDSLTGFFEDCYNLETVDLSELDGKRITDASRMFENCRALKHVDLSGLDFSNCAKRAYVFEGCDNLETIETPVGVNTDVYLPASFTDDAGNNYTELPKNLDHSITLERAEADEWLSKFIYGVSGDRIILKKYKNDTYESYDSFVIPGSATIGTKEYHLIKIKQGCFSGLNASNMSFESGVIFPNDCSNMFDPYTLRSIDLSEVDFSESSNIGKMLDESRYLDKIVVPKNFTQDVYLPGVFVDENENTYTSYPKNIDERLEISRVGADGFLSNFEFHVEGETLVITGYNDSTEDLVVPASVTVHGKTYNQVQIGPRGHWYNISHLSVEKGVSLPQDCSRLFERSDFKSVDLSNADSSKVTNMSGMFRNNWQLEEVKLNGLDTSKTTDMSNMFSECGSLRSLDLGVLDTSKVTNMSGMFRNCNGLTTLDLSGLDTSGVTDMSGMFSSCGELTKFSLGGLNTSSVTNMSEMFAYCNQLTELDLSGLDTSSVTNMRRMFSDCLELEVLNLDGFNTSKVTDMSEMFAYCFKLTGVDVSGFDTSSVTDMSGMFSDCYRLAELDVSGFDTSSVTDMSRMFTYCNRLTRLNVSGWDTSSTVNMERMFNDCNKVTTLDVSGFNMENVRKIGYMFWSCDSLLELDLSGWNLSPDVRGQCVFPGRTPVIKTPANVPVSISLRAVYTGPDGLTYTKLPIDLNESILLTRTGSLSGDPDGNVSGDPSVSGDPGAEVTKYQVAFDTENCTLTVTAGYDDETGGTPVENGDYVEDGTVLTVTAKPNNGYEMTETPAETYTVDGELTITARADLKHYSLNLNHENGAEPSADTGDLSSIPYGTSVTLTAGQPNTGYEFIGWYQTNGKQLTAEEQYTFMMYGDVTYEARYQLKAGIVTFVANDKIVKTVTTTATANRSTKLFAGNLKATDDSGIDDGDFPENPPALYGFTFTGWDKTAEQINTELADGGNVIVTAMFEEIQQDIVLNIYNGESETPEIREYSNSQWVSVTATPVVGKNFAYWTMGGEIFSYNSTARFRIVSNCTIKAEYSTDSVEAIGTATIKTVTYDGSNRKMFSVAYLTVPEGAVIEKAGLFAASSASTKFNPETQELNEDTADYTKSSSAAVGTTGPANYTWGKTNVSIGDVWYLRPYVIYEHNGESETVFGTMITVTAGYDYDSAEKATASIISTEYDGETSNATFVAYLTIPTGGRIVKAGLVAAPGTVFDPTQSVLTWENASYQKVSSKAVGTTGPATYTWKKTKVYEGDIWYARPYVIYTDAEGLEHTVYGALASVTP